MHFGFSRCILEYTYFNLKGIKWQNSCQYIHSCLFNITRIIETLNFEDLLILCNNFNMERHEIKMYFFFLIGIMFYRYFYTLWFKWFNVPYVLMKVPINSLKVWPRLRKLLSPNEASNCGVFFYKDWSLMKETNFWTQSFTY